MVSSVQDGLELDQRAARLALDRALAAAEDGCGLGDGHVFVEPQHQAGALPSGYAAQGSDELPAVRGVGKVQRLGPERKR